MDDRVHLDEEFDSKKLTETPSYAGAFFPKSRHIVVAGGTFISNNTIASPPSDYLRIPLGSIDLRHEIRVDVAAGVVSRTARRIYSARVECRYTAMTVASYQGHSAEEVGLLLFESTWGHTPSEMAGECICSFKPATSTHPSNLRNCEFVRNLCNVVDLDDKVDLIPVKQFLDSFRHSVILQVYIYAYTSQEKIEAYEYCPPRPSLHWVTPWVRRSTGRLCVEYGTTIPSFHMPAAVEPRTLSAPVDIHALHDLNKEAWVIASLAFDQWYSLCSSCFMEHKYCELSVETEVKVGTTMCWPAGCQFEDATEIAWAVPKPDQQLVLRHWWHDRLGVSRDDGPGRYNSSDVFGSTIAVTDTMPGISRANYTAAWLSQAHYIFTQLKIVSNYDDYVLADWVLFSVYIPFPRQNPPDGYLFICSPTDFQTGRGSFRWPDRPAYWSLDPFGSKPLSNEEASSLGFPCIRLTTKVGVAFWDAAVYAGVSKFHAGKGFDPNSQDVARELGHPLFELSVPVPDVCEWSAADRDEESDNLSSSYHGFAQGDPAQRTHEFSCPDDTLEAHFTFGQLVELVKFGMMFLLGLMQLYDHV
ncbi:hypothetical protein C8R45DRAFT_1099625 [Mycena sanguinolenta]|nr:hypothetical protein C8R45DRAFT_1099625 [Mycena sanguinolenta]